MINCSNVGVIDCRCRNTIRGHLDADHPSARTRGVNRPRAEVCTVSNSPSSLGTATSDSSGLRGGCQAHRQSPRPRHLGKRTRSQGPFLHRNYPASTVVRPCPTPAMAVACRDVEATTLARDGSPPITRITLPTCRAHYPGGSSKCACRLLPRSCSLPQEGRHPHCHFRGLLRLHACYGPPDRSAAQGDLCHEAPAVPLTRPSRSSATGSIDNSPGGISSTGDPRLRGALPQPDVKDAPSQGCPRAWT